MTDNAMQTINVSVFVGPIDDSTTQVRYSYTDPVSKQPVDHAPTCILNAPAPFKTVFVLDSPTTKDGWTYTGASPNGDGVVPAYSMTKDGLSLTTVTDVSSPAYRFLLGFYNKITGGSLKDDPQENNLPKPGDND